MPTIATRERLVAVKLFKLDLPPERAHQLVAEFERLIAAELTHPALAAPLATGISGVSAFLAQDYVAADSLDIAVREYGPAPVGNALRVAAQLAGALDFAAAVYVTHGALHPRDVLLSSDETRLTGLGVTRALERIGVIAPVRRPYTAPERIAGGEWDRRADVFSLAALMHELMWGAAISGLGVAGGREPDRHRRRRSRRAAGRVRARARRDAGRSVRDRARSLPKRCGSRVRTSPWRRRAARPGRSAARHAREVQRLCRSMKSSRRLPLVQSRLRSPTCRWGSDVCRTAGGRQRCRVRT